jgi:hypothetical protein
MFAWLRRHRAWLIWAGIVLLPLRALAAGAMPLVAPAKGAGGAAAVIAPHCHAAAPMEMATADRAAPTVGDTVPSGKFSGDATAAACAACALCHAMAPGTAPAAAAKASPPPRVSSSPLLLLSTLAQQLFRPPRG